MKRSDKPLVSAIIPTKNRVDMLFRALESVMCQTYQPIEVIVVDDGSIDETEQRITAFEQDIIYLKNNKSRGAAAARNQGIKAANGVFVSGLDDDDEWYPQRIQQLITAYDDAFSCVTSNVKIQYARHTAVWHKHDVIELADLLYSNQVGNQVLARRNRLLEVGGFDETLEAAQDYDLWIRLCERFGPVKNVKKPLQLVHTEHNNRITNPDSQLQGYLSFYQKHKAKMNRRQRMYQLYNIRRAQQKGIGLMDVLGWVPPKRYFKETKRWIIDRFLAN